jgi:DNA-binding transcriptional ArsR family regulator
VCPLENISKKETLDQIAELFKAFGDQTRVHILSLLVEQERCVGDIAEAVELSQSAISHQLRILKQMHLIKFRRDGKNILYSLADDHVRTILQMGLEHVLE